MVVFIDSAKPDLVFHPQFEKHLQSMQYYNLDAHFNIIKLGAFTTDFSCRAIAINDDRFVSLANVTLQPHFRERKVAKYGFKACDTTYQFAGKQPMYRIEEKGPRYVIWNESDPLVLCATIAVRVSDVGLFDACLRATKWATPITKECSVAVFDLDDTLIDKHNKKFEYADELLQSARSAHDLVVLYSHGSHLHVDEHKLLFHPHAFDQTLSSDSEADICPKNLLHLYNYFPGIRFSFAVLIDDSVFNWTPEYDIMLIPNGVQRTLLHAERAMCHVRRSSLELRS